jgi:hypothetical protein
VVPAVPEVPVKKGGSWNLGTVRVLRIEIAKLLILLILLLVVVVVVVERYGKNGLGSKVPVKKE